MKILITGASGMLGTDIVEKLTPHHQVYGMVRQRDPKPSFFTCDITDRETTIKAIERVNPKIVIHAAAMTDVDGCEQDRFRAMQVNFEGTKNVVDGSRHVKALLIYISTDFVYSGSRPAPYRESQLPHPINVYGETKLLGEFYVRAQSVRHLIIRTSWTFGKYGDNFMTKILNRARTTGQLYVVKDQKGSPTYTVDFADALARVIQTFSEQKKDSDLSNAIYHVSNSGVASRYEVACELLKVANLHSVRVIPIESDELKSSAKRPMNSALDCSRFEKSFGMKLRPWQEALLSYTQEVQLSHEAVQRDKAS